MTWDGDYLFLLQNLILKDFRTRYRNMSLGVFWSMVNPIVMMGVLTFVFTSIFPNTSITKFPVFVLCGLVPFNFFSLAWGTGTTSILDNANLIKRVPVPREVLPISSVLGNAVHLCIQAALLSVVAIVFGAGVNRNWLWMPLIWALEIIFTCGCVLLCSALDVYVRDMRYVVESASTVLFWLVPIFYSFSMVRPEYAELYRWNPLAAVVLALRDIILEAHAPSARLLLQLAFGSFAMFGFGWYVFRRLSVRFYDYL
jgi:lipopolysaccharide transport system permease protein